MARKQFNTGDIPTAADFNKFAQMQNDTATNWTAANPVLALGDVGYETDTKKLKIGDGVTAWSALSYRLSDPSSVAITGGTIGGRSVAAVANATGPSLSDYGPSNPLYVAHRGSDALYPEECKLAYDISLYADGSVALEGDVQTLSDGSLGMMHDSTVDRTTTGTGNVSSFSSSTFQALTMDSSVWLGSNYGDTLNPIMFQAYIDAYKGKGILCPEDKDLASMTALVRALINSGVPRTQALVQSFSAAGLATPVAAGYQAIGLVSANSPTASAIAAQGAQWAGVDQTSTIATYTAAGLKALVYTVNRRYLRDRYLGQGASGLFSDDPVYVKGTAALSTTDSFSRQTWVPGMLSADGDDGVTRAERGSFTLPNWWGYTSGTSPTSAYSGCLQGYLCPVANPSSFSFTFNAQWDAVNGADPTRWIGCFLGTTDRSFASNGADPTSGYFFIMRLNGNLEVYQKDVNAATVIKATTTGTSLALSTEYTFRVTVAPSGVTLARISAGAVVSSATFADNTYTVPYIQLGRSGCAARFRTLLVS